MDLTKETKIIWDYIGHEDIITQEDWNQTLMTKINFVATQIHMTSNKDRGDIITTNPSIRPILETLVYYNKDNDVIAEQYDVNYDENVEKNTIRISSSNPNIQEYADINIVNYND
jgi:hypothetical protein